MSNSDQAIDLFKQGYNCAQSVFLVYSKNYHINPKEGFNLTSAFGGGMARMQEICGAISGGTMVLGLSISNYEEDIATNKERVYHIINLYIQEFKEKFGSTKCSELLNCNLNTVEGQMYYDENNLQQTICYNCIIETINIVDRFISKYGIKQE